MAKYARWERPVQDQQGNQLEGVWTRVRREELANNPLAALYSDRAGTILKDNPFFTASGEPSFHAAGGPLWVEIWGTGYEKEWRYVPLGLGAESDIQGLVPMGLWNSGTEYNTGDMVTGLVSGLPHLYASLQDTNLNNSPDLTDPIADTAWWMHLGLAATTTMTGAYAALSDEITPIVARTNALTMRNYGNWEVGEVRASLTDPSIAGSVVVDINIDGVSLLSTKLSIDQGELTSKTAATPAVLAFTSIPDDSKITFDIDNGGASATGLKVIIAALQ